ncbi:MAG: hybrid sensor histidine kinase/response regulator [Micropepsaceae bacterium]
MTQPQSRILVIDDEEPMRCSFRDALITSALPSQRLSDLESELFGPSTKQNAENAFDVSIASQGLEGVEAVRAALDEGKPFGVVFIDMRMPPGIDGVEAACLIRAIDPQINIVIVTGYSDVDVPEMARRILPADKLFFVAKPLQVQEVRQQAAALSARWHAEADMIRALREQNEQLKLAVCDAEVARTQALQASHAKSNFISNVSHELRTPLNAIIGFSGILTSEMHGPLGDPRYLDYSREIGEAGQGLLKSINEIIDTSRLDSGKLRIDLEEVDIADTTLRVIADFGMQSDAKQICWSVSNTTQGGAVQGDPRRIAQIIAAILHNAVKFTPVGSTIGVTITDQPDFVRVAISDQGKGIPPETIALTQVPFSHESDVFTRSQGGLGLGLWLSKKLIELQGGQLQIASTGEDGTTITLDFLRAERSEKAA